MDVNKYTLSQWIRHPTTILLIVAISIIQALIWHVVKKSDVSAKDCMEQVSYLRDRVEKLELQVDEYTKAVMFKDAQIRTRDVIIDSLKHDKYEK